MSRLTYLELSLSQGKVDWKDIVREDLGKDADPLLKLLVKGLEVVLVELQTAHNAHVVVLCVVLGTAAVHILVLGAWDQERHKKGTLASLNKQHPFHSVRVGCLGGNSAAVIVEGAKLVVGTTAKVVQVEVVERLADVVEVEASLSLSEHFYRQKKEVNFSIKIRLESEQNLRRMMSLFKLRLKSVMWASAGPASMSMFELVTSSITSLSITRSICGTRLAFTFRLWKVNALALRPLGCSILQTTRSTCSWHIYCWR